MPYLLDHLTVVLATRTSPGIRVGMEIVPAPDWMPLEHALATGRVVRAGQTAPVDVDAERDSESTEYELVAIPAAPSSTEARWQVREIATGRILAQHWVDGWRLERFETNTVPTEMELRRWLAASGRWSFQPAE